MISFVVPAHDEERLIGATIDAIATSARTLNEPFEIVVVNDASTDDTALIATKGGARVLTVDLRQIAAVRNAGAEATNGEFLVFIDADTLVTPEVLASALRAMRDGAVGGGAMVQWEGPLPFWARPLVTVTRWTMRVGRLAAGCFVFATRPAFEAVGGFDTRLYATEEIALSRALKRIGRFVVLREPVITSGRKLRTYSALEMLRMLAVLSPRGLGGLKDRRYLPMWYGQRRHDR